MFICNVNVFKKRKGKM